MDDHSRCRAVETARTRANIRSRRFVGSVAVLTSMGLLTACSGIPTSGPIVAGNPVRAQEQTSSMAFSPGAPRAGDDPSGIVYGFLDATSAYQPGYDIAREFLTPEAAAAWDPTEGITVHRGSRPTLDVVEDTHVQVTITVSGEVGDDGSYSVEDAGVTRELDLPVEQVDGEWRISDPPAGTVISEDNFEREFESHNVCFFDPDFDVLLPDPVYVPKRGHVATLLAQQLLDGPSDWLQPAVRSAFPEAASLSVSSVPIETGIATVDLSENAQDTEQAQRDRMAAQLACTLAGLSEVTQIALNVDGVSLLGQDDASGTTVNYERYDPDRASAGGRLFAVQDGGIVWRPDGDGFQSVPGPLGVAEDLVEVAVHPHGDRAVAVGALGDELQAAGFDTDEPLNTVLHGTQLTSPAWDRNDLIWAVNQGGNGGEVVAVRPDGTPVAVRGSDLEMRDVDRLAISPDGTRMALVVDDIAYVAVVVHDGEAREHVSIEQLRRIGPDGFALDVAWVGSERMVVLVQDEDIEQDPEPYILDIFGAVRSPRGSVPGAVSLSAGPQQKLVAVTEEGSVMENDSRTHWINIGNGTSTAYP